MSFLHLFIYFITSCPVMREVLGTGKDDKAHNNSKRQCLEGYMLRDSCQYLPRHANVQEVSL